VPAEDILTTPICIGKPASLWHRELWPRLKVAPVLKVAGLSVFLTIFFIIYLWLLKNPTHAVTMMSLTAIDRLIPFQPGALILYVSLWVYIGMPTLLFGTRKGLVGYGFAGCALCLIGLGCFYLWPTAITRPDIDWSRYPGFTFLQHVDAAGNACPSMHVASALFSAIWLDRLLRSMHVGAGPRLLSAVWCLGIIYSTLATKQHVALDALGGVALALLVTAAASPLKQHLGPPPGAPRGL
jgi:membrane-associated phospholipid phosphatase